MGASKIRTDWKRAYELLTEIAAQQTVQDGLASTMNLLEELVPGDRGVAVMRMEGLIPYCVRWPDYASGYVPRFNTYYNMRSPFYFDSPYRDLPPVDWDRYRDTEYHNGFNRPLHIRYSLGLGLTDATTGEQYAVFVHRSPSGPAFTEEDRRQLAALWRPLSSILTCISRRELDLRHGVHPRETRTGCDILSPRESQIAELLCQRLTMRSIAERLGISRRTVERHALHIYAKLNVSGKRELIRVLGAAGRPEARLEDAHWSRTGEDLPRAPGVHTATSHTD